MFVSFGVVPFSGTWFFIRIEVSWRIYRADYKIEHHSNYVKIFLNAFSNVALKVIELGLFDLLADGLKRNKSRAYVTSLLVFVPYLQYFIRIFSYWLWGMLLFLFQLVILPALMDENRKKKVSLTLIRIFVYVVLWIILSSNAHDAKVNECIRPTLVSTHF